MQPVKKNIKHTRGDTFQFDFQVNNAVAPLRKAYFTMTLKDQYVLQKKLNDGITEVNTDVYRVRLEAEDTHDFPLKDYEYDMELTFGTDVVTPIEGTFTLTKDQTRGEWNGE